MRKETAQEAGAFALPPYLVGYTERSLRADSEVTEAGKKEGVLSMLFRMTADGVRLVHSSIENLVVVESEGMALRGHQEYSSLEVRQPQGSGDIAYQVFRENEKEVTLTIKLPENLHDEYSHIKLKRDNRVLSSMSFNQKHMAVFNQLPQGNYLLELMGRKKNLSMEMALV